MSFNPLPMSNQQRQAALMQHAYGMLNQIQNNGAAQDPVNPLPQYDYNSMAQKYLQSAFTDQQNAANEIQQNSLAAMRAAMQRAMQRNGGGGGGNFRGGNGGYHTTGGGSQNVAPGLLARFLASEVAQESGGSYSAVSSAGALGKYQIMPANVPAWSKEILGHAVSPQYFLHHPHIQDVIGQGKLAEYFRKYGAAGAASAWFSGGPNNYKTNPEVARYVRSVLRRMRSYR